MLKVYSFKIITSVLHCWKLLWNRKYRARETFKVLSIINSRLVESASVYEKLVLKLWFFFPLKFFCVFSQLTWVRTKRWIKFFSVHFAFVSSCCKVEFLDINWAFPKKISQFFRCIKSFKWNRNKWRPNNCYSEKSDSSSAHHHYHHTNNNDKWWGC